METNGNGNGYVKPIGIGVAVIVLATAILGSASNTIMNSVDQRGVEVEVAHLKQEVEENTERTEGIDVMQKQVDIIEQAVGKILEKLEK
jgi:hypothetical protein